MSTAAELLRLGSAELIRQAATAAIEHDMTKDEVRQVIQIRTRTSDPIQECVRRALTSRPRVERSELILGSLLSERAQEVVRTLGNDRAARKLQLVLAGTFPDVVPKALRISGARFSLLLSEADAASLRSRLEGKSIEATLTEAVETIAA